MSDQPLFRVGPDDAVWDERHALAVRQITEDHIEVLAGRPPRHARLVMRSPDGGSTLWEGAGYTIVVLRATFQVGGVAGVMHGPIIELDDRLGSGNPARLSDVRFYATGALDHHLDHAAWRAALGE